MSFSSILSTIDQYIKIAPWLQFVGTLLSLFFLLGIALTVPHLSIFAKALFGGAFIGNGVALAGFDYKKIYP